MLKESSNLNRYRELLFLKYDDQCTLDPDEELEFELLEAKLHAMLTLIESKMKELCNK